MRSDLFRRLAALGAASALLAQPARAATPPPPQSATWGFESWECGQQWFEIRLGSGADVVVDRIDGVASAIVGPNADTGRRWVRAALVTLTTGAGLPASPALVLSTPPERAQQAVSGNLMSVILKQRGDHEAHVPLSQVFAASPVLPGGRLRALVDTQTYTGTAAEDALVPRDHPEECLDSELQLVVQFHERR